MIDVLVLKAIRDCNLRCTYCYYINDDTPNFGMQVSDETIRNLYESYAAYLRRKGKPGGLIWHGGEPLMLGRERLGELVAMQQDYFAPGMLENRMQTNGLLIDDKWIDFFFEHDFKIGLSLDGTREAHDEFRVTKGGHGSYDLTIRAIERMRARGVELGVLSVLGGTDDGRGVLTHMRDELGIRGSDFLFPMKNNVSARRDPLDVEQLSDFLCSAFDAWTEKPELGYKVRIFRAMILNALGVQHYYISSGAAYMNNVVVVETDGSICLDTEFSQIDRYEDGDEYYAGLSVHDGAFRFELVEDALERLFADKGLEQLPDTCRTCRMRSVCRAGHPSSRYDDTDGTYNHPSAYCDPMYRLSERIVDYLVDEGLGEKLVDPDLRRVLVEEGRLDLGASGDGASISGDGLATEQEPEVHVRES